MCRSTDMVCGWAGAVMLRNHYSGRFHIPQEMLLRDYLLTLIGTEALIVQQRAAPLLGRVEGRSEGARGQEEKEENKEKDKKSKKIKERERGNMIQSESSQERSSW